MTLTDVLPSQVTFVSSTPGSPTCSVSSGTLTCSLPGLAPGASQAVAVQVPVAARSAGDDLSSAVISANEFDPFSGNNSAPEQTLVVPKAESELGHGTLLWEDLASAGGLAAQDYFRIAQQPYSSYEVLVDATGGDLGNGQGPQLDRTGPNGLVLQSCLGGRRGR